MPHCSFSVVKIVDRFLAILFDGHVPVFAELEFYYYSLI